MFGIDKFDTSGRRLFYIPILDADYEEGDLEKEMQKVLENDHDEVKGFDGKPIPMYSKEVGDPIEANLVGSSLVDNYFMHKPVLDIDFEARLIPSKTEGHYHLYLDGIELPWGDYVKLLEVLAEVGILEQGYVNASIERGMTRVRIPNDKED